MDVRKLIPRASMPYDATPMGTRPINRWVEQGAGGDPFEPAGWFPHEGNTYAHGYDGLDLEWQRASARTEIAPVRDTLVYATQERATFAPIYPRPRKARGRRRFFGLGDDPPPADQASVASGGAAIPVLVGLLVGAGLAYIVYDETMGTGSRLR